MDRELDLTPSPRILEVIAETDLKIYQCLAELVDNCFDELARDSAVRESNARVEINIPKSNKVAKDSTISVADTGAGMTPEQLEHALRAGSSSNARFGSLGLFGMGFNVATARMGNLTTVKTGRVGDAFWSIATIDINSMKSSESYIVPLDRTPKSVVEHGTVVTVTQLREDTVAALRRPSEAKEIRNNLGRIYTYMLRDPNNVAVSGMSVFGGLGLSLLLNDKKVVPVLPCTWDPDRSVTYKGVAVPAVLPIDFSLNDAAACMDCGHWMRNDVAICSECGSDRIEVRERNIHGWIGIQRYNHTSDFGVSVLRQGRVILYKDKSLFSWTSDDGVAEVEYPAEIGGGRIVGEIHLDHAPVNFRKTDFDHDSSDWRLFVEYVRGLSPLKPRAAISQNLGPNTSPLGQLFNAYRRNDPGLRYLVPGNGKVALHDAARTWATLFNSGNPAYLSDEKWYESAYQHDNPTTSVVLPPSDTADLKKLLDLDGETVQPQPTGNSETHPSTTVETSSQRLDRYRQSSSLMNELSGPLSLGKQQVTIQAYSTSAALEEGGDNSNSLAKLTHGKLEIFVRRTHPLHSEFGLEAHEIAAIIAAGSLRELYLKDLDIDQVLYKLYSAHPDLKFDFAAVRDRASNLLAALLEALEHSAAQQQVDVREALHSDDVDRMQARMAELETGPASSSIGIRFDLLDADAISNVLISRPDLILDGAILNVQYRSLSPVARKRVVRRIDSYLADIAFLSSANQGTVGNNELQRAQLGLSILEKALTS